MAQHHAVTVLRIIGLKLAPKPSVHAVLAHQAAETAKRVSLVNIKVCPRSKRASNAPLVRCQLQPIKPRAPLAYPNHFSLVLEWHIVTRVLMGLLLGSQEPPPALHAKLRVN